MSTDLEFATPGIDRYSIITLIFFIPYVLCQPPATVIMRKLGPRRFLPVISVLWGGVMIVSDLQQSQKRPNLTIHSIGFRIREYLDRNGRASCCPRRA